ncbi:MAG: amidohydrolase family protein [bacterium]
MLPRSAFIFFLAGLILTGCDTKNPGVAGSRQAFIGARIIDGAGAEPIENGVLLVNAGRIETVGPAATVPIPKDAERIDLRGKTVLPGLINAHGHVGGTLGLEGGHYSEENVLRQLRLYARYGVTTVNSLGGDGEAGARLRSVEKSPGLNRARLLVAGDVVTGDTPKQVRDVIDRNAAMKVDFIKIRVDDNLGSGEKMPPEIYRAVIEHAHRKGLRVAAHLFYLEDAKALLKNGADFLAHSVRDREVDDEFIQLLKEKGVGYCPTLVREVSTFVYEDVPDFFNDPFFLKEADPLVLTQLKNPERQERLKKSAAAQQYKKALEMALRNLKKLSDAGVTIVFGTDTGPPARFQGYFEHLELELMAKAGLTPMQIIVAATGAAAKSLGLDDRGTLEAGKWADFIVLSADPLENITNARSIESVWIAGNRVPEKEGS